MKQKILSLSVLAFAGTLIFIFAGSSFAQAPSADAKVAEIKKIVGDVNKLAASAETEDPSSVFIVEVSVNSKDQPYPAVGTFNSVAKLYYTYGDREKSPYPNKLIKASITTRRSADIETVNIYFRGPGEMIMYSKVVDGAHASSDQTIYMLVGLPIQFEKSGKVVPMKGAEATAFLKEAMAEKDRITKIFEAATR